MFYRAEISILFLMALVTSCALHQTTVARRARAAMIGLSQNKILECMGPTKFRTQLHGQGQAVWRYPSYEKQEVKVGKHVKQRPACVVEIYFQNNHVSHVDYNGKSRDSSGEEKCASTVANCVGAGL